LRPDFEIGLKVVAINSLANRLFVIGVVITFIFNTGLEAKSKHSGTKNK